MTPELITALFTGAVGILGAISAFTANRGKQSALEQKLVKGRLRVLEKQNLDMIAHIFKLERAIIQCGCEVPERPKSLDESTDEVA